MGFLESLKGARRRALLSMVLVAMAAIGAGVAGQASAGNAGQTAIWGIQGAAAGHLSTPNLVAAEDSGAVLVGDRPAGPGEPFRLQKFSATGTFEGAVEIPTPEEEVFAAMAVDSTAHLVYLLRTKPESDPETERPLAEEILVFSTIPVAQKLEAPATNSTISLPSDEEHAIDNPADMVFDSNNNELEISGENQERKFALQRISVASGSFGALGPRYTETGAAGGTFGLNFAKGVNGGLAVGPTGTSYVAWKTGGLGEELNRAVSLAENLQGNPAALPNFPESSVESIQISRVANAGRDGTGPQIAVSPDGSTLYFKIANSINQATGGNILVFAYGLADGHLNAVYGGKKVEGSCTIQSLQAGLAPVGETLFVLDQGSEEVPSPYGSKVIRFGSGGTECPASSALTTLKVGSTPVTEVHAGKALTLDASGTELGEWGESITSVTWTVEGPETLEKTVLSTEPNPLTLQHTFTAEGAYTVRMFANIKMKAGVTKLLPFDAKPRSLTVTAPATVPAPTITEVSPNHGSAAGGNTVTIKGTELAETTSVLFGATAGTGIVNVSATEITVKAPAGTAGTTVDVNVTTQEGGPSTTVAADKYTYEVPTQTLSVTKNGTGSGTVTSSPAGISCGAACSAQIEQGKEVALTATAASGSTFAGWGGACAGTGSCRVTLSTAKNVIATFTLTATEEPPPSGGQQNPPPGGGGGSTVIPPKEKTAAEKLAEKRQAALKKCKKLKGKAKTACVKKANAIGKPKKHAKKHASRAGG
jgi:hypothetical protein